MPFSVRHFPVMYFKLPLAYISGFWLLITLLVLSSRPAYAEWVVLSEGASGVTVYIDPDTIRRKGDLVKMWHLFDYKTADTYKGNSFLSIKAQRQYDCADERTRSLAEMGFSGNRGRGKLTYSNPDETKWEPVPPESVFEALWTFACDKK